MYLVGACLQISEKHSYITKWMLSTPQILQVRMSIFYFLFLFSPTSLIFVVNSVWMKLHVEGEVPSRRVLSCMISMRSYGILISGKAVNPDNFVYLFDPASRKWTRKSALPKTLIGIQCTEQDGMIHIYGGHDVLKYLCI